MSSEERIASSRANGALSRGRKTPECKARSSRNATRHGLLSNIVVLEDAPDEAFHRLCREYARRFGPLTTSRPAWLPPSGASSNRLNLLHRNETRLHTMFQRAFKNLLTLRKTAGLAREVAPIPNEPKKSRVSNKSAPAEPNSNLDLPPGEPILDTTPQGS